MCAHLKRGCSGLLCFALINTITSQLKKKKKMALSIKKYAGKILNRWYCSKGKVYVGGNNSKYMENTYVCQTLMVVRGSDKVSNRVSTLAILCPMS